MTDESFKFGQDYVQHSPQTLTLIEKLTNSMEQRFEKFENCFNSKIEKLEEKIDALPTKSEMELTITKAVETALETCDNKFLLKEIFEEKFNPVRNIVWGVASAVGLGIVAAVMALIIK